MSTTRLTLLFLILVLLVQGSAPAHALVLCTSRKGAKVVTAREACGAGEVRLDPATLGVQGGKGDRGARGPQGLKGEKGDTGSPGASASDTPGQVQAWILLITAGIVLWYTIETKRLRETAQEQVKESQNQVKEAQRQTELQLRPFVILTATHENLHLMNIGNGPAINVKVQEFTLSVNNKVSVLPEPVPVLLSKEPLTLRDEILAGEQFVQGEAASSFVEVLRPPKKNITRMVTRNLNEHRPEIIVEFENLEGQRYFVKESLKHGILEILDSGRL